MPPSSTVTILFKFRLVPQGRRRRWEHWHNEKSQKVHPGPRWDRISPNDDQVQARRIRPVRMASGQLRAIVHLQELVSILHPVHQGLRRTMGLPTFDRFSVSQVPQDHLPSVKSVLEWVKDFKVDCLWRLTRKASRNVGIQETLKGSGCWKSVAGRDQAHWTKRCCWCLHHFDSFVPDVSQRFYSQVQHWRLNPILQHKRYEINAIRWGNVLQQARSLRRKSRRW